MVNQSPDLMCVVGSDWRLVEINEEWTRVLGWTREELVGQLWTDHVLSEDQLLAQHALERLAQGAYIRGVETRWRSRDGQYRFLSWNAQGDPDTRLIFAVARDITDEREAEQLRDSQHALEVLVTSTSARLVALTSEQLPKGIERALREVSELLRIDHGFVSVLPQKREGLSRVAQWTRAHAGLEGVNLETLPPRVLQDLMGELGRTDGVLWTGGSKDASPAALRTFFDAGARSVLLVQLAHAGAPIGLLGLIATSTDHTWLEPELVLVRVLGELFASSLRRRAIETELLESEERFRNVVQASPMGMHMYELQQDGRLVLIDANPAAERITGLQTQEIVGRTLDEAFPKFAQSDAAERFRLAASAGVAWQTTDFPYQDGRREATLEMYAFQTMPGRMASMFLDVTARKRTERALSTSEQRLRAIFEAAVNVAFIITDANGGEARVVEASPGAENTFGYRTGELVGVPLRRLNVPDGAHRLQRIYERMRGGGEGFAGEMTLVRQNGGLFPALVRTYPLLDDAGEMYAVLIVGVDVSEQRQLEAFLQQAQKMEALGTLAGGIAHDFNNILGAVMGYSELARLNLPEDSSIAGHLDQVLAAAARARDLVAQILAFSRRGDQEMRPLELAPIVREVLRMLRASIPKTIEIRQRVSQEAGVVRANPTQIHQVLMNLCTNAAHAMQEQGGVLEVEVAPELLDEVLATHIPDLPPGNYVKLSVRDTGHGIEPSTIPRIFDPYFTTKDKGVGTGLGLAVVHGIVKACGGGIQVASEVGVGTVFDVYFPQVEATSPRDSVHPTPLPTGTERILFVDDEEALVITTRRMLERLGYRVTVSLSSREALERFSQEPSAFDLVITDQTMPHLTGDQLAKRILELRPHIPIILCTGFSETMTEDKAMNMGVRQFLMKPLVLHRLATAVRSALDSRGQYPA